MNNTRKSQQKSSIQGNATGLTDNTPTNQNKSAISRIAGDFGSLSQNSLNFTAQISLSPVQKINFLGGVSHE